MTSSDVRACIQSTGIIPAVRVNSAEDALYAAKTIHTGKIPIAEITMTIPGATEVIAQLVSELPDMVVGAGTCLDCETAKRCLDAGAMFITSTGLDLAVVEMAKDAGIVVLPGALTPTEIISAWKAGADFVKVFPCAQMGGEHYVRALKVALPHVPLIAAGGVRQSTAPHYIHAGATAIGIGRDLIPNEAVQRRNSDWILELAQRFLTLVKTARHEIAWKG